MSSCMNRRDFLRLWPGLPILGAIPLPFLFSCAGTQQAKADLSKAKWLFSPAADLGALPVLNLDSRELFTITVPNRFAHWLAVNPARPETAVLFDWQTNIASEIDFVRRRLLREFRAAPRRLFGGHGEFSADGKLLFIPQYSDDGKKNGYIGV